MSILQKNLVSNNRLKTKNIFGEKQPKVVFNANIKSTNLHRYYFTNYIDNKKSPIVKTLKSQRRKMLSMQVDYDKDYEIKNILYKKNEKAKINDILQNTIGTTDISFSMLYRLKYIDNPEIQFFFLDNTGGIYEVILIDIYHLVLPAPNKARHENKANPKQIYSLHKNAQYCLSNIFHR